MNSDFLRRQATPLLIVISGPSGVGKDAVLQRMKERGLPFHFVVTATSRPRRPNEVEGTDYHFVSREEFDAMVARGEMLEHALVYNDYKGIPRAQVAQALASGRDVALRVDVQGAATIRSLAPQALLIFLLAGSDEELERRLRARRTESEQNLALRLETARREIDQLESFDYAVVNRDFALDATVDTIVAIIHAEHHRSRPRQVQL
ncbi:MAG TPA: guanylate kinase [Anaerolineales bacterium]|nr:guanylate kinase [Anaerolineales bacterium]